MTNKKTIFWVAVLAVGIGLTWYGSSKKEAQNPKDIIVDITPSSSVTPGLSPAISPTPLSSQQPEFLNKYPPAECSLTGNITFISPTIYENKDADIIYKNIDSIARHIIWMVSPEENLSVGPNLFVNLPLPDGVEDVTVVLPNNPRAKNYIITAKVTYGVLINKNLEIKEASCTGQIPVEIKY